MHTRPRTAAGWESPATCVHVIDREADSVGHFRAWDDAGHRFLVRADDRKVQWRGEEVLLSKVTSALEPEEMKQLLVRLSG